MNKLGRVQVWLPVLCLLAACSSGGGEVENSPPVAVAGEDFQIQLGQEAGFDGSESYDPDGDPITFRWSFDSRPAGSQAQLEDADTAEAWFTPDVAGQYVVSLVVNDGKVDSAPDTVTVTVTGGGQNNPPVANAGPDRQVQVGQTVTLDGSSSSDPDGDQLSFAWSFDSIPQGSSARLSGADTATPSFQADVEGQYVVKLVVNDGELDSQPDTVTITATQAPSGGGWSATYGLEGTEEFEDILATDDGGFIGAGLSDSYSAEGDADAVVAKVDGNGQVVWAYAYGGSQDDMAIDIEPTPDGGFVVAGWTRSFGAGGYDAWLLKIGASGQVEWARSYGGAGDEQAWSVDATGDGGYVFSGGTTSFGAGQADFWVVKVDSSGNVQWENAYGGSGEDAPGAPYDEYVCRVAVDKEGKFIVSSISDSYEPNVDMLNIRLEPADGSVLWAYGYGHTSEDSTWSFAVLQDGGYLFTGALTDPVALDADVWALKTDTSGNIVWQKTYGLAGWFDEALGQAATSDGGALLAAWYKVSDQDWRSHLVRIAADGSLMWAREYRIGEVSWPNAAVEIADGFGIIGSSAADAATWDNQLWFMKTASDGSLGASCQLGAPITLEVKDAPATRKDVTVTVTPTSATVTDTAVTTQQIAPAPTYQCQ